MDGGRRGWFYAQSDPPSRGWATASLKSRITIALLLFHLGPLDGSYDAVRILIAATMFPFGAARLPDMRASSLPDRRYVPQDFRQTRLDLRREHEADFVPNQVKFRADGITDRPRANRTASLRSPPIQRAQTATAEQTMSAAQSGRRKLRLIYESKKACAIGEAQLHSAPFQVTSFRALAGKDQIGIRSIRARNASSRSIGPFQRGSLAQNSATFPSAGIFHAARTALRVPPAPLAPSTNRCPPRRAQGKSARSEIQ